MEERRHSTRYPCNLQIKILGHDDDFYLAEACDISVDGMSLLAPRSAVAGLSESGMDCNAGCRVKISLPNADNNKEHRLICEVAHTNRVSQEQYIVGLHFEDFAPETRAFINGLLKNPEQ